MARKKNSGKIDLWLKSQPVEDQEYFRDFCRQNYHSKPIILDYLMKRSCPVSLATVYIWVKENIAVGMEAGLLNQVSADFIGVELKPILEKQLCVLVRLCEKYQEIIEEKQDNLTLEQANTSYLKGVAEIRALIGQIHSIQTRQDNEALVLAGAVRAMEIALMSHAVRDKPEEPLVTQVLQASVIQVGEEISGKRISAG